MKFSVIIPLYNKSLYIKKALESVINQTFKSFDLIVVDDGSTDDSLMVADKVLKGTDIEYRIIHQKNQGVSIARNNGVAASNSEYICFLDADDWWEPLYLEEMSSLISGFPEAGLYGCSYSIISDKNHKTRYAAIGVDEGFEKGYIDYFKVYAKGLYMPIWTGAACVPRKVFNDVHGFNPKLRMSEDFDLWVRIATSRRVALLNIPLSNYNQDILSGNRAIGSLPPPESQFAFCADYLNEAKKQNPDLKFTVEMVQITCLRNYYLSKDYRLRAQSVLDTLDLNAHRNRSYAGYLFQPRFIVLMKDLLYRVLHR